MENSCATDVHVFFQLEHAVSLFAVRHLIIMQTPPVKPPADAPPPAPKVGRSEGYGQVLVPSVTLYMASGSVIGPLKQPRHAEDWSTSMLRLQVGEILGILPLESVRFMDMNNRECLSNNHCVNSDLFLVVSMPE